MTRSIISQGGVLRAALLGGVLLLAAAFAGATTYTTPAGSQIGNQATATYTDANGNQQTVTSNVVYTTVQQVASVTLTANGTAYALPGGQVAFPQTVTNTGNGPDSFLLSILQSGADNFDLTNVAIYPDLNGDGIPDAGAAAITSTTQLPAGGVYKFVIVGTIPITATTGEADFNITATSVLTSSVTATDTDKAYVTTNAVVNVTKSVNPSSGAPGLTPVTFTLKYVNSGMTTATNVTLTDAIPAGMTYVAGSGLWSVSTTTPLTDAVGGDPTGINYSYSAGTVTAIIASVAPGINGTVTFQVGINSNAPAGAILNSAGFSYGDGGGNTPTGTSNTVSFQVTQVVGVTLTPPASPTTSAAQGTTVSFSNVVKNTGNKTDTFDIVVNTLASTFPAGSSYTLYASDGNSLLLDSNGNGIPDTGPLAAGASYTVILKVTLPPSASGNNSGNGFAVSKTATSTNDPTVSSTGQDKLSSITGNTVDLTNNSALPTSGGTGGNGAGYWSGGASYQVLSTTMTGNPGIAYDFILYVNNTSSVADSYGLNASTDSSFATIVLPSGWAVTYYNSTGTVITSTGDIAAGGNMYVKAHVTTAAFAAPGNYDLYFKVLSPTSGAWDCKWDRVTINQMRELSLTPNGTGEVYAGSSIVYMQTLTNPGNVTEGSGALTSVLNLTLAETGTGFSGTLYLDNGDGVLTAADTQLTSSTLPATLTPGASVTIFLKVYAPVGAAPGAQDVATITASATQGVYVATYPQSSATDTTTVITGDIDLQKWQSLDGITWAQTTLKQQPGSLIHYKIVVTNTGAGTVTNITVTDPTPPYTVYNDGNGTPQPANSACFTTNGGGSYTAASNPGNGNAGTITAAIGTLTPGAIATVYFNVTIVP